MDTKAFTLKTKLTGRAKLEEETKRACKVFLDAACNDRLYLLAIVTGGKDHFKKIAAKAFHGFLVDDDMIAAMFGFLVEQAGPEPVKQYEQLQQTELVALKVEKLKGLARFIDSTQHLDEVLERAVPNPMERQAIRTQMLVLMKAQGVAN